MSHFLSDKQLLLLKQALMAEKQQLQSQIEHSFDSLNQHKVNELSRLDNHQADYATELFEATQNFSMHEELMNALDNTEAAIARLEGDSYGYCHICQQPISFERLQANPSARYCIEHQPTTKHYTISAAEERFSDKNNDNRDATFFDGEDTNQLLSSYGTSDLSQYQNYNYEFADEFDDALQSGVEKIEDFIATDITGKNVFILRNSAYSSYINEFDEQDHELN